MKKHGFRIHLNIGTVVFGVIFVYLIITLVLYALKTHVETYQVSLGPLSGNDTYTALILRDETVVKSSANGYVNYYVSDSSKVAASDLICSVTADTTASSNASLSEGDYEDLRGLAATASKQFSSINFENVYNLQYSINNILWDSDAIGSSSGNFYSSTEDGIISTLVDGFEYMTEAELTADLGQNLGYSATRLKNHDSVSVGDTLYRMVSGEEWSIYFALTDEQLVRLASLSDISVKFLSDNNTEEGTLSFITIDDQRYGKISFSNGLIRYVDQRYVDFEVVTNNVTGLKIPVSAIVTKEFYVIPESFLTYSGDSDDEVGFLKEVRNEDGTKTTEFTEVTVYEKSEADDADEAVYYVDKTSFDEGDILVATDSDSKYTIGAIGTLEGVYCVNKGYAVFRKISIIDQNSEYCIVEEGTSYGLSLYDYIV